MIEILMTALRQAIETVTGCRHPKPERQFHKHPDYLSYGLKASDFRRIMKEFYPIFIVLSLQDRLNLAVKLLSEHIGELGHVGIHVVALSAEELKPIHFPLLDRIADDFRSWSHVDHFCYEVIKPLLGRYREEVMVLLEDWNRSANRFKRRSSVVTFTRKVGESGEFIGDVLRLCENLIWDKEDIVQKGVGWALKDNLRSAPERILPFIEELRRKGVPSTITLYAIKDLKGAERDAILAVKKGVCGMESKILSRESFLVAGTLTRITPEKENAENYGLIWKEFESHHNQIKPLSTDKAYYGVSFASDEEGVFDYVAGMAVKNVFTVPQDLVICEVPSSRFAVFECPVQSIGDTYQTIFGEWLPKSSYEINRSAPVFEQYPPEGEVESPVRIHIPIKEKVE